MRSSSGGQQGGETAENRCGQRSAERPWWRGSSCKGKERALRPCRVAVGGWSRGQAVGSLNMWVRGEAEKAGGGSRYGDVVVNDKNPDRVLSKRALQQG